MERKCGRRRCKMNKRVKKKNRTRRRWRRRMRVGGRRPEMRDSSRTNEVWVEGGGIERSRRK